MNQCFSVLVILFWGATLQIFAEENLAVLRDGSDVYSNVTVTTITATDIYFTFNHGTGIANAKLKDLSPELRQHFNYNLAKAGEAGQKQAEAKGEYHYQLSPQPTIRPPDENRQQASAVAGTGDMNFHALPTGSPFPDFVEKDRDGNPLSVAQFKGKVLLLDFYATWCPPCRSEIPNVIATYQKHQAEGFEVLGISLDQSRNDLESFLGQHDGMTYLQYFDGQGWNTKLAVKYGVRSIPFAVLIGRDGRIIARGLRGEALEAAVENALAAK
jgi:thiol-disulfide isomerase/thioredoxin